MELVNTGAFHPTKYASLTADSKVAKQLYEIGVPIRVCEGFNYCYDIDCCERLERASKYSATFIIKDRQLVIKMYEYMKQPDWDDFKQWIQEKWEKMWRV